MSSPVAAAPEFGSLDFAEHLQTYRLFVNGFKYGASSLSDPRPSCLFNALKHVASCRRASLRGPTKRSVPGRRPGSSRIRTVVAPRSPADAGRLIVRSEAHPMRIAVPAETDPAEARVAATPETVKKLIALGASVLSRAGRDSNLPSSTTIIPPPARPSRKTPAAALADADIILRVRRPAPTNSPAPKKARCCSPSSIPTAIQTRCKILRRRASTPSRWS